MTAPTSFEEFWKEWDNPDDPEGPSYHEGLEIWNAALRMAAGICWHEWASRADARTCALAIEERISRLHAEEG